MSGQFIERAQNLHNEGFPPSQRYLEFCRWVVKDGLPVKSFRFWLVLGLLAGAVFLGLYVKPLWIGCLSGLFVFLIALSFLVLGYTQALAIGLLENIQKDKEALQDATREVTEMKQTIFFLVAANDELRKTCSER